MSDDLRELQRRLEQATAAECPADEPLDAETASLREGWTALGQLLEAAERALEEPFELRPMPRRRARPARQLIGVVAMAASLLVAATLAWNFYRTRQPVGHPPPAGGIALPDQPRPAPAIEQPLQQPPQPTLVAGEPDPLDWDDSLDDQLASAAQEIIRIQQDWYGLDDAYTTVYDGLEQVEEDLGDNQL